MRNYKIFIPTNENDFKHKMTIQVTNWFANKTYRRLIKSPLDIFENLRKLYSLKQSKLICLFIGAVHCVVFPRPSEIARFSINDNLELLLWMCKYELHYYKQIHLQVNYVLGKNIVRILSRIIAQFFKFFWMFFNSSLILTY